MPAAARARLRQRTRGAATRSAVCLSPVPSHHNNVRVRADARPRRKGVVHLRSLCDDCRVSACVRRLRGTAAYTCRELFISLCVSAEKCVCVLYRYKLHSIH